MKNLYIGNIPQDYSEEQLYTELSSQADIQKVAIFRDRYSDDSLGFGYLTIEKEKELHIKSTLNGFDLNGRKLVVN